MDTSANMKTSMQLESQLLATKFYVPIESGTLISRPRLIALLDAAGQGRIGRDLVKRLVDQADCRTDDAIGRLLAADCATRQPTLGMQERCTHHALHRPLIVEVEGVTGNDRLVLQNGRLELTAIVWNRWQRKQGGIGEV